MFCTMLILPYSYEAVVAIRTWEDQFENGLLPKWLRFSHVMGWKTPYNTDGDFLEDGYPQIHFKGIFPNKNHPFGGSPMTMETPI